MKDAIKTRLSILFALAIGVCVIGTIQSSAQCTPTSNNQLRQNVQVAIDNTFPLEKKHIKVYSVNCKVYVLGWVANGTKHREVLSKIAATNSSDQPEPANYDAFYNFPPPSLDDPPCWMIILPRSGASAGGTEQCGDICVPNGMCGTATIKSPKQKKSKNR